MRNFELDNVFWNGETKIRLTNLSPMKPQTGAVAAYSPDGTRNMTPISNILRWNCSRWLDSVGSIKPSVVESSIIATATTATAGIFNSDRTDPDGPLVFAVSEIEKIYHRFIFSSSFSSSTTTALYP